MNCEQNRPNNLQIKVSVIMLTYNQEKYIDEAIRSVMLQEFDHPYELIIGNDASTDRTTERCLAWKEKYPNKIILLNHKKNIGFIQNFIHTYSLCQGEYIAICEGDDYWCDKTKLKRQIDFLDTHAEYSTCIHRVINYFETDKTKSLSNGGMQKKTTDILDLAKSNYITNVSSVFRRGLFGELPDWFSTVSTYDYAIHLMNAQYGKIYYMKRPMAIYRQHKKSIWSMGGNESKLEIALKVRELLIEHYRGKRDDVCQLLMQAHSLISLRLIHYFNDNNQTINAQKSIKRLQDFNPSWTISDIEHQLLLLKKEPRFTMKKILKFGRAIVSRFIPLPRIKE